MDSQLQLDIKFYKNLNYDLPEDLNDIYTSKAPVHIKEKYDNILEFKKVYDDNISWFEEVLDDFLYVVKSEYKEYSHTNYPGEIVNFNDLSEHRFDEFLFYYNDLDGLAAIEDRILMLEYAYGFIETPIDYINDHHKLMKANLKKYINI